MNEKLKQGELIVKTIGEFEKFALESENLKTALKDKIALVFKDSSVWKPLGIQESHLLSDSGWFYEWQSISVLILKKPKGKFPYIHLSYQSSNVGDSVKIPCQISRPLVHVFLWEGEVDSDCEYYVKFPFKREICFGEFIGDFDLYSDSLIVWKYDFGARYWLYSVDLLYLNSKNIEELLINPARRLLEDGIDSWALERGSSLDKAIVKYPSVGSFSE